MFTLYSELFLSFHCARDQDIYSERSLLVIELIINSLGLRRSPLSCLRELPLKEFFHFTRYGQNILETHVKIE